MFLTLPQMINLYTNNREQIDNYFKHNKINIRENFKKITQQDIDNTINNSKENFENTPTPQEARVIDGMLITILIISFIIFVLLVIGIVRGIQRGMPICWTIIAILGFFFPPLQIATIMIVIYYNFIYKSKPVGYSFI